MENWTVKQTSTNQPSSDLGERQKDVADVVQLDKEKCEGLALDCDKNVPPSRSWSANSLDDDVPSMVCVESIGCKMDNAYGADLNKSKSGKRRSDFSRGRVSLTQLSKNSHGAMTSNGNDLHKQIPADLPPAKRLCMLSRIALRHTLDAMGEEFDDVTGFETFKSEALDSVGDTIDRMHLDGSFETATACSSLAQNPANLQMSITISQLTHSIERMRKENEEWDKLVSRMQSQTENAKGSLKHLDVEFSDISAEVKELSKAFLPSQMLDLDSLCRSTVRDVKNISLLMDQYCYSIDMLNMTSHAAQKHMDHIAQALKHKVGCKNNAKEIVSQCLSN